MFKVLVDECYEMSDAGFLLQTTHSRELQDVLKFIGEWCGTPPGFSF